MISRYRLQQSSGTVRKTKDFFFPCIYFFSFFFNVPQNIGRQNGKSVKGNREWEEVLANQSSLLCSCPIRGWSHVWLSESAGTAAQTQQNHVTGVKGRGLWRCVTGLRDGFALVLQKSTAAPLTLHPVG